MAKRTDVKRPATHDDHVDGCDLDFRESATTPDHELPAAKGGVAMMKASRGKKRKAGKRRRAAHR